MNGAGFLCPCDLVHAEVASSLPAPPKLGTGGSGAWTSDRLFGSEP